MIGRTAGLLVELPVDLQPIGWRLVDRPGRDASRTGALLREDLDELAEAFDGHVGPLKLQVVGPWTLAANVWLSRGERVIVDEGACRDLVESLAEGVRLHVAAVRSLVPGARGRAAGGRTEPADRPGRPAADVVGLRSAAEPRPAGGRGRTHDRARRPRRGHGRALLCGGPAARRSCARPVRPRCRSTPRCCARASGRAWRSRWRTAYASTPASVPTDGEPHPPAGPLRRPRRGLDPNRPAAPLARRRRRHARVRSGRRVARRGASRAARRGRDRPRARGAQRRVTLHPDGSPGTREAGHPQGDRPRRCWGELRARSPRSTWPS